jgi:hypothetical protein
MTIGYDGFPRRDGTVWTTGKDRPTAHSSR